MQEMKKNPEGGEKVLTESEKRDQSIQRLKDYADYQNRWHGHQKLGVPKPKSLATRIPANDFHKETF